jgi:hypothetical protein
MEDEQVTPVVERLREFRDRLSEQQRNAKIPMRVFALSCEQLI